MSNIDRIPIKDAPRLMEAVVREVQVQLGAGLQWLDHVFGKAEKVAGSIRNRLLRGEEWV